jgi:hypothetical protein
LTWRFRRGRGGSGWCCPTRPAAAPSRRRRQTLALTTAGERALRSAQAALRERLATLLADLTPPEADALARLLPRLEQLLSGKIPPPRRPRPAPPPPPRRGPGRGPQEWTGPSSPLRCRKLPGSAPACTAARRPRRGTLSARIPRRRGARRPSRCHNGPAAARGKASRRASWPRARRGRGEQSAAEREGHRRRAEPADSALGPRYPAVVSRPGPGLPSSSWPRLAADDHDR